MGPIRGQTRPLPVKEEIAPQKIGTKLNASIHNRFDVEVVDSVTGEVRQRAQAENVICNAVWSKLNTSWNSLILYGSGSGSPTASDTALFAQSGYNSSSFVADAVDTLNSVYSYKRKIVLSETDAVGETITEIGIGDPSQTLMTHALLKDMNGNAIAIAKTDTDIITIYSTVFCHYSNALSTLGSDPSSFMGLLKMAVGGYRIPQAALLVAYTRGSPSSFSVGLSGISVDASAKKLTIVANRVAASDGNYNGIYKYELSHYDSAWTEIFTVLFASPTYTGSDIVGEAIGTGDGTTKAFATDFIHATSAIIYVDGVAQAGVTVTDAASVTNNIVFATAPVSGAVITADYHTSDVAKDVNHVFDFSLTLQLGEHAA